VKLNPGSKSSRSTTSSLSGAELLESLVKSAQESSGSRKRNIDFQVLPLITTLSPERLDALVEKATKLDPTYEPTDFKTWYQVDFTDPSNSEEDDYPPEIAHILKTLSGDQEVASAERLISAPEPRYMGKRSLDVTDDVMFRRQGYLGGEESGGIAVNYAWGFEGGDGAGTTIIDIEGGWNLDHEDLAGANITLMGGVNHKEDAGSYSHGTAVLGQLFMQDNSVGGVGIVPGARGGVVSRMRHDDDSTELVTNQPEAIFDAVDNLEFGDIILLEMQTGDNFDNYYPIEIYDAEFDAIRLATALGITVIEAAGNGGPIEQGGWERRGMNMDEPIIRWQETTPVNYLNRSHPDFRDSGAIVVGASSSSRPHQRMDYSNYGSRVDVFSWGENVATSDVNGEIENGIYTYLFSGTSSASPIIAGAAASIQGMVYAMRGSKLSPAEMREMIVLGGSQSANPSEDKIGVQPNLKAIINGHL